MAKNKNNKAPNTSKQKYKLREQPVPVADKSADPPQPQGKMQ